MTRLIKRIGLCVPVVLLSVFVCTAALAQTAAQITGTVKDQSGAVLPGVEVTAIQTGTEFKRTATTESKPLAGPFNST